MKKLALVLVLLCMTVVSKAAFAWEYTRPAGNIASIRAGYLYSCDEEAKYRKTVYEWVYNPYGFSGTVEVPGYENFTAESTGYSISTSYELFLRNLFLIGFGVEHMWMTTDIHHQEITKDRVSERDDRKWSIDRKTVIPSISLRVLLPWNLYLGGVISGRYEYESEPFSYSYTSPGPYGTMEYSREFSLNKRIDAWGYVTGGILFPVYTSCYLDISASMGKRFTDYQWAKVNDKETISDSHGTRVYDDVINFGKPKSGDSAEMSGTNDLSFRIGVVYDFGA